MSNRTPVLPCEHSQINTTEVLPYEHSQRSNATPVLQCEHSEISNSTPVLPGEVCQMNNSCDAKPLHESDGEHVTLNMANLDTSAWNSPDVDNITTNHVKDEDINLQSTPECTEVDADVNCDDKSSDEKYGGCTSSSEEDDLPQDFRSTSSSCSLEYWPIDSELPQKKTDQQTDSYRVSLLKRSDNRHRLAATELKAGDNHAGPSKRKYRTRRRKFRSALKTRSVPSLVQSDDATSKRCATGSKSFGYLHKVSDVTSLTHVQDVVGSPDVKEGQEGGFEIMSKQSDGSALSDYKALVVLKHCGQFDKSADRATGKHDLYQTSPNVSTQALEDITENQNGKGQHVDLIGAKAADIQRLCLAAGDSVAICSTSSRRDHAKCEVSTTNKQTSAEQSVAKLSTFSAECGQSEVQIDVKGGGDSSESLSQLVLNDPDLRQYPILHDGAPKKICKFPLLEGTGSSVRHAETRKRKSARRKLTYPEADTEILDSKLVVREALLHPTTVLDSWVVFGTIDEQNTGKKNSQGSDGSQASAHSHQVTSGGDGRPVTNGSLSIEACQQRSCDTVSTAEIGNNPRKMRRKVTRPHSSENTISAASAIASGTDLVETESNICTALSVEVQVKSQTHASRRHMHDKHSKKITSVAGNAVVQEQVVKLGCGSTTYSTTEDISSISTDYSNLVVSREDNTSKLGSATTVWASLDVSGRNNTAQGPLQGQPSSCRHKQLGHRSSSKHGQQDHSPRRHGHGHGQHDHHSPRGHGQQRQPSSTRHGQQHQPISSKHRQQYHRSSSKHGLQDHCSSRRHATKSTLLHKQDSNHGYARTSLRALVVDTVEKLILPESEMDSPDHDDKDSTEYFLRDKRLVTSTQHTGRNSNDGGMSKVHTPTAGPSVLDKGSKLCEGQDDIASFKTAFISYTSLLRSRETGDFEMNRCDAVQRQAPKTFEHHGDNDMTKGATNADIVQQGGATPRKKRPLTRQSKHDKCQRREERPDAPLLRSARLTQSFGQSGVSGAGEVDGAPSNSKWKQLVRQYSGEVLLPRFKEPAAKALLMKLVHHLSEEGQAVDEHAYDGESFEESSHTEEEPISLEGHGLPPPVPYHGPAFPPEVPPQPTMEELAERLHRSDLLVDKAREWVEEELMARLIQQFSAQVDTVPKEPVAHTLPVPHRTNRTDYKDDVKTDSEMSDEVSQQDSLLAEALGDNGFQVFVNAGVAVDENLVHALIKEVLLERIHTTMGQRTSQHDEGNAFEHREAVSKPGVSAGRADDWSPPARRAISPPVFIPTNIVATPLPTPQDTPRGSPVPTKRPVAPPVTPEWTPSVSEETASEEPQSLADLEDENETMRDSIKCTLPQVLPQEKDESVHNVLRHDVPTPIATPDPTEEDIEEEEEEEEEGEELPLDEPLTQVTADQQDEVVAVMVAPAAGLVPRSVTPPQRVTQEVAVGTDPVMMDTSVQISAASPSESGSSEESSAGSETAYGPISEGQWLISLRSDGEVVPAPAPLGRVPYSTALSQEDTLNSAEEIDKEDDYPYSYSEGEILDRPVRRHQRAPSGGSNGLDYGYSEGEVAKQMKRQHTRAPSPGEFAPRLQPKRWDDDNSHQARPQSSKQPPGAVPSAKAISVQPPEEQGATPAEARVETHFSLASTEIWDDLDVGDMEPRVRAPPVSRGARKPRGGARVQNSPGATSLSAGKLRPTYRQEEGRRSQEGLLSTGSYSDLDGRTMTPDQLYVQTLLATEEYMMNTTTQSETSPPVNKLDQGDGVYLRTMGSTSDISLPEGLQNMSMDPPNRLSYTQDSESDLRASQALRDSNDEERPNKEFVTEPLVLRSHMSVTMPKILTDNDTDDDTSQ